MSRIRPKKQLDALRVDELHKRLVATLDQLIMEADRHYCPAERWNRLQWARDLACEVQARGAQEQVFAPSEFAARYPDMYRTDV